MRKFLIVSALLMLLSLATAQAATSVPADAKYYEGHAYKVYDTGKTWASAKSYCESLGGHLVTITSSGEQSFVSGLISSMSKNSYWLGGYKSGNTWKWITKESWSYSFWASRQPDNYHSQETRLMMYRKSNPLSSGTSLGKWNDLKSDGTCNNEKFFGKENFGFICEWESTSIADATIKLSKTKYDYDGTAKKPGVTVTLMGVQLTPNTDYTVKYSSNTKAGTATVKVTGAGKYKGSQSVNFKIYYNLSKAAIRLSQYEFIYTGSKIKPTVKKVTIQAGGKTLTISSSSGYTVKYADNKEPGRATVTITGKDKCTGSSTVEFTIAPSKPTSVKLTPYKTKIEVAWKASGADYYEVRYGTKKDGSDAKTVTTKTMTSDDATYTLLLSKNQKGKVLKSLTRKTTYYVWVRGITNGVASEWTAVKSTKTK
ncbi:MAG: hypothetical protein IJ662_10450 [Clostridia bacterium]|nr:hypothetical protein [Clostridia bacterium]